MQFSFTLSPDSVQLHDLLIQTIRHHDNTISKKSAKLPLHTVIYYTHTLNKQNQRKTNPTQKTAKTAHWRQSVNQTPKEQKKSSSTQCPSKTEAER